MYGSRSRLLLNHFFFSLSVVIRRDGPPLSVVYWRSWPKVVDTRGLQFFLDHSELFHFNIDVRVLHFSINLDLNTSFVTISCGLFLESLVFSHCTHEPLCHSLESTIHAAYDVQVGCNTIEQRLPYILIGVFFYAMIENFVRYFGTPASSSILKFSQLSCKRNSSMLQHVGDVLLPWLTVFTIVTS